MKILQIDQFHATSADILKLSMGDFEKDAEGQTLKLTGDSAETATAIFGSGFPAIKEVDMNDNPSKGEVWFKENPETKLLEVYKYNYDSSD